MINGSFACFFVLRFPRKNSCPKYKNNIFSYLREEESVIFAVISSSFS